MSYEWHEVKRRANLATHKIDFKAVEDFEWDTARVTSTCRHGETRYIATGYVGYRLHTVVYTERGERKRLISLRKASARETRDYAQA